MKNAFKDKKVIIIALILLVVSLAISFGLFFITASPQLNLSIIPYNYLLWIFGFVFVLIGFIWGDARGATWRRKNKEWDSKLPDDLNTSIWKTRLTFYIPSVSLIAIGVVFEIIYMVSGAYPFM